MNNFIRLLCFLVIFTSCTFGLTNARTHIPEKYNLVYLPAAQDGSIYAGQSSRLTFSLRDRLSRSTDLKFTGLKKATWALDVKIQDKVQIIQVVDTCNNPGNPTVASGAFFCSNIHPEITTGDPNTTLPHSFNQPSVSPRTESTMLYVQVRAIDLKTGAILWAKNYSEKNLTVQLFNEIGDPGDGRTMTNMQYTPNLHALRYREAVDRSIDLISDQISQDVLRLVFRQFSSH